MGKVIGFILMILGLAIIVVETLFKQIAEKIPFITGINQMYIIIAGIVIIILGILMLKMGGSHASGEIPIYQGNKVVGYRRK